MSHGHDNQAAALLQQAVAHHRQGRLQEALVLYQQLLAAHPDHAQVLHGLGVLYAQAGRHEEALRLLQSACAVQPDDPDVHFNQAKLFQDLKRHHEALTAYGRSLALRPHYPPAQFNRGNVLRALGQCEEAVRAYDAAIAFNPNFIEAYNNRGSALLDLQRHDRALADYEHAIALRPGYVLAHNNRGTALERLGRREEALLSYERAIALQADFAAAHNNRGNVLKDLGRHEESLASFERALILAPADAEIYNNRGIVLKKLGRYDEALLSFDRAIALRPDFAEACYNKGHVCLLLGDYQRGWPLYEWRWRAHRKDYVRKLRGKLWSGDQPLAGRTILLHAEQGYGDIIQFVRYVPEVAALGAHVILEAPATLLPLLRTLSATYTLIASGAALAPFELHCPLMSLPLAFGTTLDTIPATLPYLSADPQRRAQWRQRLGPRTKPRIGLAWSGSRQHSDDRRRSIPLRLLKPLLGAGLEFHSLQQDVREQDLAALEAFKDIHRHEDRLRDFADTAALVAELDLVISVDTAVAHLAGALGKTLYLLLPGDPDFRWLLSRRDSPWYPTATLFRQGHDGDWQGVVAEVAETLQQLR